MVMSKEWYALIFLQFFRKWLLQSKSSVYYQPQIPQWRLFFKNCSFPYERSPLCCGMVPGFSHRIIGGSVICAPFKIVWFWSHNRHSQPEMGFYNNLVSLSLRLVPYILALLPSLFIAFLPTKSDRNGDNLFQTQCKAMSRLHHLQMSCFCLTKLI